jgi:hypothetical protein
MTRQSVELLYFHSQDKYSCWDMLIKAQLLFARTLLLGIIVLYLGFFILAFQLLGGDVLSLVSFVTGVPFIITSLY